MASTLARVARFFGRSAPIRRTHAIKAETLISSSGGRNPNEPVWFSEWLRSGQDRGTHALSNPIVYRCIRMICEASSHVPWTVQVDQTAVTNHPISDLLHRPNLQETGAFFFERFYGHLLIHGDAFLFRPDMPIATGCLYALHPDLITIHLSEDGWPASYSYSTGKQSFSYPAESRSKSDCSPILHVRGFSPLASCRGLAPLQAAIGSVNLHDQATHWNRALFENAARPSGALVYSTSANGELSDAQFDRLRQELEENYQGALNAGRPLLLDGGLDWKPMAHSPREMDFLQAKAAAARDIALAFGIPPPLLGLPGDNTYANYQEANRSFWRQTVLPLVTRVGRELSAWLAPTCAGVLEIRPDVNAIAALTAERHAMWEKLELATFLTRSEKRRLAGFPEQTGNE